MAGKIGLGIAITSLLIFIGIIIFGVVRRIIYKNKYKLRCTNQIKLKRVKLLPIYYLSNSVGKLLLLLIVSIICIFTCMISLKYMMVALPLLFASLLSFVIIYLINFDVFDSLMFIKKKVEEKYEMADEPISSNAIWLSKRDYFQTPTDRDVKNISFVT